jgi:hypothetical protein
MSVVPVAWIARKAKKKPRTTLKSESPTGSFYMKVRLKAKYR